MQSVLNVLKQGSKDYKEMSVATQKRLLEVQPGIKGLQLMTDPSSVQFSLTFSIRKTQNIPVK